MKLTSILGCWWQAIAHRGRTQGEVTEEMEFHLDARAADLERSGLDAQEARRRARLEMGRPETQGERYREAIGLRWLDELGGDLRYAWRMLWRSKGFTAVAVLTLALGIGANTAIFTLVHAILLKDLPVRDPKALVRVGDNEDCCILGVAGNGNNFAIFSTEAYRHLRDNTPEFEQLAAMAGGREDLSVRRASGDGSSHSSQGEFISGNYFQTFGVPPLAGRTLMPGDDADGAAPVAMISYRAWQRDYAGDPAVIGSSFYLNTHPVTIVGVTPQSFYGDQLSEEPTDFYLPISQEPTLGLFVVRDQQEVGWLFLIGRVKHGTALGPLQEKMNGLLRQSLGLVPEFQTEHGKQELAKAHVVLTPGSVGIANMQDYEEHSLYLLMGLAGLVLLIACANIANLMLVRGLARRGETSIRMALGAARSRVVRQMLTESMVLACLGGGAGLLVAYAGTKLLLGLMFSGASVMPVDAAPSLPVLEFAFGVSLLTGLIFGMAPAWITSTEQPANAMRGVNRSTRDGSSLLQRSLVIVQAALSVVLLMGAGLLGKSLNKLQHQSFGLEMKNRVVVSMNPLKAGYKPEQLQGLYQQMEDRFQAMPGVEHVGLTMYSPLEGNRWSLYVYVQGQRPPDPGKDINAMMDRASPDYFKSIGQRVVRGRTFTAKDTATAPGVAVVNQAFVNKLFKPGEDPIGQHFGSDNIKNSGDFEIVGVVADAKYSNPHDAVYPMYFLPMLQQSKASPPKELDSTIYVETMVLQMKAGMPGSEEQVRRTLASIDPNLTVDRYQTFEKQIEGNFNEERMIARLTLLFGLLALVLAAVGLYGVTAYMVERRTAEIGIRMALGAERTGIVGMVLRGAMLQTAIGLVIGVPVALWCVRYVQSQLYEVVGRDAGVIAAAVCTLAVAAFVSGIIPARRAASIEPMQALRME